MRARDEHGQAVLEFFFAILLAMVMILGTFQIALLFNAHSLVKLAAFNAARAAIVARGEKPEDPVTLEQMRDKAKLAAFLTILPVIPWVQGRLPSSLLDSPDAVADLIGLNGGSVEQGLLGFGQRAAQVAFEFFLFLDVQFVDPEAEKPTEDGAKLEIEEKIEFDDPTKRDENLLKVLVTWQYPLVIPFAKEIVFAASNPIAYLGLVAVKDPARAARIAQGLALDSIDPAKGRVPVWARGRALEQLYGGFERFFFLRVPVRATSVMRMQWDRGPGEETQAGS